jgi:hypothetical protein
MKSVLFALIGWVRKWLRRIRIGWKITGWIHGMILLLVHVPVLIVEEILCLFLEHKLGAFPSELSCTHPRVDVILAAGLNSTPYSIYYVGVFLRKYFRFRILFLQTPKGGNTITAAQSVALNRQWIREATGKRPLYAIGFSFGGIDLVWQFMDLLEHRGGKRLRGILTVNTPFLGSALAKIIKVAGARELEPNAEGQIETLDAIETLRSHGVIVRHFCSFWDMVARKSDTRGSRPIGSIVPSRFKRYVKYPLMIILRQRHRIAPMPDWWSYTLPHIGHTANMNPLACWVLGRHIDRHIRHTTIRLASQRHNTGATHGHSSLHSSNA